MIDFLNDNNQLNLVNENPKDMRTHGKANVEILFKIFIINGGRVILV